MLLSLPVMMGFTADDQVPVPVREHQIEYGDPNYMVPFDPHTYTGHTPLPNNKALGNNQVYYRMDYSKLTDGVWIVTYPNKKKKIFLRATVLEGKPAGTWMYYYSNGNKMKQFLFEDGLWKGAYTEWYPKGEKKIEQMVDRTAEVCGTRISYDKKGRLITKTWLKRDVEILTRFYEDDQLTHERAKNQEYFAWRLRNESERNNVPADITYKVYFKYYTGKVEAEEAEILLDKGSERVERPDGGFDYYIGGEFLTFDDAQKLVDRLYQLGYPQTYVVAFQGETRIASECVTN